MCTKDFRSTKAITLIALVVSIVVLLILAGVSIVTLTGDNGLLNQTTGAKQKTELATFKEKLNLAYMSVYTDNAQNGTYTVSMADVLGQLVIDYPEYGQVGKIVDGTSGGILSIKAKLGTTEVNTTNPLILGTGETKTIVIEPTTPQGAGGTKFVNLEGKYYQIILDGNGVTLGEAQDNLPESENELEISKGEGLGNVSATEKSDLNVEIKAGSTLDAGNITFTYGGKTTTVAVQVKTKHTVTVQSEDSTNKGTVEVSPTSEDNKYAEESTIRLTATAKTGYQLEGWYNGTTKLSENNPFDYEVGTSDITITAKFKIYEKYGKIVNLGTVKAKNDVAMTSGWRYFLEDTNNIYLMYGDYLENAQIPAGDNITVSGYLVYASGSRDNLVNYLNGATEAYSSIWSTINAGVKAAVKARLIANGEAEANANVAVENIATKGAPTPEQWMSSYNENYGTKLGAESFASGKTYYNSTSATSVGTSTATTRFAGYLYTRDNTVAEDDKQWETYLPSGYMNQLAGYPGSGNSNMYYPHAHSSDAWNSCSGYWLARPFGLRLYRCVRCGRESAL